MEAAAEYGVSSLSALARFVAVLGRTDLFWFLSLQLMFVSYLPLSPHLGR